MALDLSPETDIDVYRRSVALMHLGSSQANEHSWLLGPRVHIDGCEAVPEEHAKTRSMLSVMIGYGP